PESPTYGQWEGLILSEENKTQFWIPPGLAHGFVVLSEIADFEYKCTDYYTPGYEGCLAWDDSDVNIKWPIDFTPILSDKDKKGLNLKDLSKVLGELK
ncbi:TPA: dTDP-4-dehydrorhamnose 3,5-epimerase family protein, partial [Klebsiella pneumoniae]|nr:dTDP-4-dehydrorhamnose 3,5-epimerase family protein [Klebsiella pneumoniae]